MELLTEVEKRYLKALGLLSGLTLALFIIRLAATQAGRYLFLPENLILAWLPLLFGWLLVNHLKLERWRSWRNIALTLLWLFSLPNAWYVLTDFIHVYPTGEISQLYDIVLIFSLAITGLTLGFTSLYLVHKQLLSRLTARECFLLAETVILISSFAIYMGRILRWNSWDAVTNPGVLLNVSDRIVDPLGNPRTINITGLFFVLLSVLYIAIWLVMGPRKKPRQR